MKNEMLFLYFLQRLAGIPQESGHNLVKLQDPEWSLTHRIRSHQCPRGCTGPTPLSLQGTSTHHEPPWLDTSTLKPGVMDAGSPQPQSLIVGAPYRQKVLTEHHREQCPVCKQ